MRAVLRWTVRILLGLLTLVVAALIGVAIWLNTESAQRLLHEKIVSIANAQLASGAGSWRSSTTTVAGDPISTRLRSRRRGMCTSASSASRRS